jgi:hypothetical protein
MYLSVLTTYYLVRCMTCLVLCFDVVRRRARCLPERLVLVPGGVTPRTDVAPGKGLERPTDVMLYGYSCCQFRSVAAGRGDTSLLSTVLWLS